MFNCIFEITFLGGEGEDGVILVLKMPLIINMVVDLASFAKDEKNPVKTVLTKMGLCHFLPKLQK